MVKRVKQAVKKHLKPAGYARWMRALVALVLLVSLAIPAFSWLDGMKAYAISPEAEKVIGSANKNLSAKFSFDQAGNKWQFNKNGVAALASNIAKQQGDSDIDGIAGALSQVAAKQVGGAGEKDTSLYSVDLPVKAKEGITYYDNVTRLSFKMVPSFSTRDAKLVQDRIVYPFMDGAQIIYTAKSNGLKEDIVLSKYIEDTVRYSYTLELPETLKAKLLDDGSIGIYSANPALFGNISFSNDEDKARIMDGRKNGDKDNLVFNIPPPFIKDQTGNAGHTKYYLNGNRLTVVAEQLKNLKYPLTVDPSVTVTSSSDFATGNNEGMSSFDTADQITRGGITGGSVGAWHFTDNSVDRGLTQNAGSGAANGTINTWQRPQTTAYNGYMYIAGGRLNGSTLTDAVERAPINSNGTLGTWVADTVLPAIGHRHIVAYNGYMYAVGGAGVSNSFTDVYYAPISTSNGSLGAWVAQTPLTAGRNGSSIIAYNNMLYMINGCENSSSVCNGFVQPVAEVICAPLNANGTVGTWNNSCGSTNLTGSHYGSAVVYNGFVYAVAGCSHYNGLAVCDTNPTAVQYTKIKSDGTLDTWVTASTSFSAGLMYPKLIVANGYLYLTGNNLTASNIIEYAPVYASGDIGSWTATSNSVNHYTQGGFQAYGNYLYTLGGCASNCVGADTKNAVEYSRIDSAGAVGASNTANNFNPTGRAGVMAAAAFGYLYALGGFNHNTVRKATINSDGSVGTWADDTNTFSEARGSGTIAVYNGFLYLIGGANTTSSSASCTRPGGVGAYYCNSIEWASIDPNTGVLTWQGSTYTYSSQGRSALASAINNGYLYVLGGIYANNSTQSSEVNFAQINADGTLGTFNATTAAMNEARADLGAMAHNGRIYAIASRSGTKTTEYATPNPSTGQITSWSTPTGTMPGAANSLFSITVSKGYVYVVGGVTASPVDEIQIAKINADGSFGAWSLSSSVLGGNRRQAGVVAYNDYLYVIGGYSTSLNTSDQTQTWYHRIGIGGSGSSAAWSNQSSMATARAAHATTTYNNYVYSIGGCSAVATSVNSCANANILSTVTYAAVDVNGVVGTWNTPTNLPSSVPRFGLSAVAYNGYLYVSGGCSAVGAGVADCTTFQNDVHYAPIASNGSLGSWSLGGTFTTARFGHSLVVNNGYLYILGGCSAMAGNACTTFQGDVQYSQIGSNGTFGSWSSAGTGFSTGRFYQSAVINSNNLYVLGGCSAATGIDCTSVRSDIQRSALNAGNGTLTGGWTLAGATPKPRYGMATQSYNGHLYIAGGCGANSSGACSTLYSDIEYIPFTSSGLGARWNKSVTDFSNARLLHGIATVYGHLVLIGGNAAGTFQSQSRTSPISVIDRVGHYSKLREVSPTTDIASVFYNGTFSSGSSLQYKVAPSSGVFGATSSATQGTGSEPTPLCGVGSIYYVHLMMTLDDSRNAVYPDDNTSALTEVMIYHRINATPAPNQRLNGGKWFYGEVQQPLDICRV